MGRDNGDPGYGALNSLKPQPGQTNSYTKEFHPLPGEWAKMQLDGKSLERHQSQNPTVNSSSEIQVALRAEDAVHKYWEEWQGVTPGKPVYEDPRAFQNTLLPAARFGTDGRGY